MLCLACAAFFLTPLTVKQAEAKEKPINFDAYDEVEIVSIAPPYYSDVSASVIFKVYFSAEITHENYKHIAASREWLEENLIKSPSFNPSLTVEKLGFLVKSGVWESIRNCITLKVNNDDKNVNTVADFQNKGNKATAVMIHLGELDVNICMQMEFSSSTQLAKDLSDEYTFYFKKGLKFPSGVILKEDSNWKYIKSDGVFEKIDDSVDASDTSFVVNYDGKTITDQDNVVKITDKNSFSMDKIYVKTTNLDATVTIEKDFEELRQGYNYILVTCTSQNKTKNEVRQIVIEYEGEEDGGCSSSVSAGSCACLLLLTPAFMVRRKKK